MKDIVERIVLRATKDKHEKEDEEVTRLVRESPKDRSPRRDKERERIKEDDPDIDGDPDTKGDKDLSMNYKDIGGSDLRAVGDRLAARLLVAFGGGGDDEEDDDDDDEDEEEPEEDDEDVEPERVPPDESDIQEAAAQLYTKQLPELYDMVLSDDYTDEEQKAIRKALQLKTAPLPPNWKRERFFENGMISLKGRQYFRKHMKNWSIKDFADNLTYFRERLLNETLTQDSDEIKHYYQAIIELVEGEYDDLKDSDVEPMTDLDELLGPMENPEEEFDKASAKVLRDAAKGWHERLRKTGRKQVEQLLDQVRQRLAELDKTLTVEYAWLRNIKLLLRGVLEGELSDRMETPDKEGSLQKRSQYRGIFSPMDRDAPDRPVSPSWKRKDPLDLNAEDYVGLLVESKRLLGKPFISRDLYDHDFGTACRVALDHAIFSKDEGKYSSTVDAPTYQALVDILIRVVGEDQ